MGIKLKKTQTMKNIHELTGRLQEIPNVPATHNIAKNRMAFPMHEQLISNSKTKVIT